MRDEDLRELLLRAKVQFPRDIMRVATSNAAELFGEHGETGVVVPGAPADLLIVDGGPSTVLGALASPDRDAVKAVTKDAVFYKEDL